MSDQPLNGAWWQASNGKWYPPEQLPGDGSVPPAPVPTATSVHAPSWTSPGSVPPVPPKQQRRSNAWPWLGVAAAGLVVLALIVAAVGGFKDELDTTDVVAEVSTTTAPTTTTSTTTTSTTTTTTTSTTTTTAPPTTTTAPPPPPPTTVAPPPPPPPPPPVESPASAGAFYANCTEARAAGAAPVLRGQPGYGSHLDRDGDGVGCE